MCYFGAYVKRFAKGSVLTICFSTTSLFLVFTFCPPSKLIMWLFSQNYRIKVSFLVWPSYFLMYLSHVLQLPLSLTLWQHAFLLNPFLVVQETVDTFGLVCLGFVFVGASMFTWNMLFTTRDFSTTQPLETDSLSGSPLVRSSSQLLSRLSTTLRFLGRTLRSTYLSVVTFLKGSV